MRGNCPSNKMSNLRVRPGSGQALRDEATMAALRGRLAAEEATHALREQGPTENIRDASRVHQRLEARDVPFPVMVLAIGIANLVRRRQLREMDVASTVEAPQKPGKVILLGEPRQLPTGFEADIDDLFDPMFGKESEEALR